MPQCPQLRAEVGFQIGSTCTKIEPDSLVVEGSTHLPGSDQFEKRGDYRNFLVFGYLAEDFRIGTVALKVLVKKVAVSSSAFTEVLVLDPCALLVPRAFS